MDAIALHQYGFDCAVASLGTSLTQEHADMLSKYTDELVLTYDGDEAGQNATQRAHPHAGADGPAGAHPADARRKGPGMNS